MLMNYMASCSGANSAGAVMKASVDVWINGMQFQPSSRGEFTVPVLMYHDLPTVTTVETLKDVEMGETMDECRFLFTSS